MDEELKEDPCLIDAIESEVNGALKVLKKAELGEKVEYATDQHQRETAQIQVQLPNHYFVADEIKQHPNEEQRTVVIVRDDASKTADVVLPQGASLEVNNEIKGMNKQRFTNALQKEGYDNVRFYNPTEPWASVPTTVISPTRKSRYQDCATGLSKTYPRWMLLRP